MNNAILIQQVWQGDHGKGDFELLLELNRARNEAYCKRHGFDYETLTGTLDPKYADITKGGWVKIEMIRDALAKGYEHVVWLDPDALIKDLDTDLRDGCPKGIGACWMRIPQLDHWNVGVIYLSNTWEVKNFVNEWLAMYPGDKQWMEQGAFNKLAMKSKVVETISDRWNATLNYNIVPDAVVLGYHGNGTAQQRLEMMKATLEAK